jgi:hypothetical protein
MGQGFSRSTLSSFRKGSPSGNRENGVEINPINFLDKFSFFMGPFSATG